MFVGNESNELSKISEAISTEGLTKDLVNGIRFLMPQDIFSSGIFQNYLVFIRAKNTLNILMALLTFICGNLMVCPKKVLKI